MNKETNAHLTEAAMLRLQTGDASPAERAHADACAVCRAQAKPMIDALSWFGTAARQWGEERAGVPREWNESKAAAARTRRPVMASWAVACVVVLLVFTLGLQRWNAHRRAQEAQARQQQMQQELARDNALLEEVDRDVSQVVPEAMQPLSWSNNGGNANSSAANNTADAIDNRTARP